MTAPITIIADTETTGIDVTSVGVCQIAAVALMPGTLEIVPLLQMYAKPSAKMSPEAEEVHGITPDKYATAPTDAMAVWVFIRAVLGIAASAPVILSGYNSARYDYPILKRISDNVPLFDDLPSMDVMHVALRRDTGQPYKLVNVFEQECMEEEGAGWLLNNAHDAMSDCHMTARVLRKFLRQRGETDAGRLQEELITPKPLNLMIHGKYAGVPFSEVPASYLTWAAAKWDEMPPDLEASFKKLGLR